MLEELARGADDPLQPPAVEFEVADVAIGPERRHHHGVQLLGGQLGLFPVVVDVEIFDHLLFRRVTRLAGAQNDANVGVAQLLADMAHRLQPGMVGLHHDVEQQHRDFRMLGHDRLGLGGAPGAEKLQRPAGEQKILQQHPGDGMNLGLVVGDQHPPRPGAGRRRRLGPAGKQQRLAPGRLRPLRHDAPPRRRVPAEHRERWRPATPAATGWSRSCPGRAPNRSGYARPGSG